MKQYRLLKDLPDLKKGTVLSLDKSIFGLMKILTIGNKDVGPIFISNAFFGELFEEIQEESTDSIHWNPRIGEKCFILENANIRPTLFTGMLRDYNAWRTGRVFRTEEECEKACNRELAEVRLRRTSTFKSDFKNGKGGWIVGYDHQRNKFLFMFVMGADYGEPVHYETKEDAEKSIKENREDWLIYFGIEEEK
nr:MAG TPA: hypothetical protein [Caudoviricetes sp.]